MRWYTTERLSSWSALQQFLDRPRFRDPSRWIFRGQANAAWELKPTLERIACDRFRHPVHALPFIEARLGRYFKRNLHRFVARVPADDDILEWNALMQHHGAPTRLLDWTYSFHVALFFAVEGAAWQTRCAVWVIDHRWLIETLRRHPARPVQDAFKTDLSLKRPEAVRPLLASGIQGVVPLVPFFVNERLATQQGVFLAPLDLEVPFMENLGAMASSRELRRHVVKIEIPIGRNNQWRILNALHRLNINLLSLFPGIDGFARSLATSVAWMHRAIER